MTRRLLSLLALSGIVLGVCSAPATADTAPVASAAADAPAVAGSYHPVTPTRLLDTGTGTGAPRAAVAPHTALTVQITGRGTIPTTGAAAVTLTVIVASPTTTGHLVAYATGTPQPATTTVDFTAHQTIADQATITLGTGGRITLYNASSGTVRLVADATGYHRTAAPPAVTGLGAQVGFTTVRLAWQNTAPVVPSDVVVRRATGSTPPATPSDGQLVADLSPYARTVTDSSVAAATTYAYSVFVLDQGEGYAAPATAVVTTDAWSAPQSVDPPEGRFDSVSCPTTGFCLAVDQEGNAFRDDAGTWRLDAPRVVQPGTVTAVSCSSATFCVAMGTTWSEYDGTHWTAASPAPAPEILDVSCTAPTFCAAVTNGGYATTFDGAAWSAPQLIDNGALRSVSCLSSTFCMTSGGHRFDGATWQATTGTPPAGAVACGATTSCVGVSADGTAARFDGSGWSSASVPQLAGAVSVACAASACVAGTTSGSVVPYDGATWGPAQTIDGAETLQSVSCASATACVAVDSGTAGDVVTFDGAGWSAPQSVDPARGPLLAVSCASGTSCVGLDEAGFFTRRQGTGWTPLAPIDPAVRGGFGGISCPAAGFCLAVTTSAAWTFDGSTWTSVAGPSAGARVRGVSCVSPTSCLAVDEVGTAYSFDGTAWTAHAGLDPTGGGFSSVSCTAGPFCVVGDFHGGVLAMSASGWAARQQLAVAGASVTAVSCSLGALCTAVDDAGSAHVLVPVETTWTSTDLSTVGGAHASLFGAACAGGRLCVALDSAGKTYEFDGTTWRRTQDVPRLGPAYETSLTCPATNLCLALDSAGGVATATGG